MSTDFIQPVISSSKPLAVLLFITCFSYLFFLTPHPADNVLSRADLTASIVNENNLNISEYHQNTLDKSFINGQYFSDKAPGISLFSLPAAYVFNLFSDPIPDNKIFVQIITIFSVTIPVIMLIFIFFKSILIVSLSENIAIATSFSLAFSTLLFPYATLLYGHATGAAVSFFIFYIVFLKNTQTPSLLLLAGVLCALLTITEYPLALHSVVFFIFILFRLEKKKNIIYFIAGVLPLAILFFAYNKICYGGYFTLGYFHESWKPFEEEMKMGLAGVTFPSISSLSKILFNPGRGLFIISPILILVIPGIHSALKTNVWKSASVCAIILIIASITINSSQYLPLGGMAPGPRHLIPVLPYFLFLISFSLKSDFIKKYMFPFLAGFSFLAALCFTVIDPHVHEIFDVPIFEFYLPTFFAGIFRETWISHFQPSALLFSFIIFINTSFAFSYHFVKHTKVNKLHFLSMAILGIVIFSGLQFAFYTSYSPREHTNKKYTRASTWDHMGFIESAEKEYLEIVDVSPDHYMTHFSLGVIEFNKTNKTKAVIHFRNAIRANPAFSMAHYNLARILQNSDNLDEAISHYSLAVSTDPYNNLDLKASSFASIAIILYRKGEYDECDRYISLAKNSAPTNPHVLKVDSFINNSNRDRK